MEPIVAATDERWPRAARMADAFRGSFIDHHTRGETMIGEALLALQGDDRKPAVALPHLAGQRLAELRKALDARKSACPHLPHVITVLDRFQRFETVRNMFCHGVATLTLDREGRWCQGYKLLRFRANAAERETLFLTEGDAATLLSELAAAVGRLPQALGHVHKLAAAA